MSDLIVFIVVVLTAILFYIAGRVDEARGQK